MPSEAKNHRRERARQLPPPQAQGVRGPHPSRAMEHQRLDQVRVVGGASEGLQSRALRLGTSSRGRLLEPHAVAEVHGGGDEEQVHQPRAQRLEPHSVLS